MLERLFFQQFLYKNVHGSLITSQGGLLYSSICELTIYTDIISKLWNKNTKTAKHDNIILKMNTKL